MIDKEAFLKATTPERVVLLPGVGEVRLRGLTRAEAVSLKPLKDDVALLECTIIHLGLVSPALTMEETQGWYASGGASALTDLIVDVVTELSGLSEGAPKSGLPEL